MSQPSRLEKKAQDCINRGEFYEAHQVYRTLYFRMTQQEHFEDLLQILCTGSQKLGDVKESLSALDLAELYAETLLKAKCEPSEKIFDQLYTMLLQLCDPKFPVPNADSLNKFISTCVKWSQIVASRRRERKHGLSELHYVIARAFSHHHNYVNARNHMLFADHPEEFAKLLHTIREEGGSKSSEAEIFCVLPCLQLLAMHRVHTASKLLAAYVAILNESPSCNGSRDELFHFLKLLFSALNLHDVKLFDHLLEAYKPHLDVDPTYHSYLERIGQIFFGNPPKSRNDAFGGLFGNILKGVLGEKKEEDEIFSDSDFEAGSMHTGRDEMTSPSSTFNTYTQGSAKTFDEYTGESATKSATKSAEGANYSRESQSQPLGDRPSYEDDERGGPEEGDERKAMLPKSKDETPQEDTTKGLARSLTLTNGVTMIVGCIIGSGIFVSPTGIQEGAGSVGSSILVWILCGIWCTVGAYCYAELGTLITKSGGDYAYLMEAFGPFIAFLRLWIESIVVRPCAIGVMALTFALYLLRPIYPNCPPPPGSTLLLAATMIIILTGVNCWSVKYTAMVQDWFTFGKVLALLSVILIGGYRLIFGGPEYKDSFDNLFEGNFRKIWEPAVGFYSGLFSFQGWAWLNFITEELINPERNLPLAILISMGLCTVIYTLFNIALYTVISPDEMLVSPAVAVLFAEKEFGMFAFMMPIFVAISTFGSVNGTIMTSSRLFFCGAREGQMPVILTMINKKHRTPIPAVIFTSFLAIVYLLIAGHIYTLINASQCTVWLAIAVVSLALLKFRWSMPDVHRPVKVPIVVPVVFTIGSLALVALSVYGAPKDTVFGLLLLFSAVPIYIVFISFGKLPDFFTNFMYNFTVFWQKLLMVVDDNEKK